MLTGMGTVFIFLTLLVFLTSLLHRLVERSDKTSIVAAQPSGTASPTQIAAITAAINQFRKDQFKNNNQNDQGVR